MAFFLHQDETVILAVRNLISAVWVRSLLRTREGTRVKHKPRFTCTDERVPQKDTGFLVNAIKAMYNQAVLKIYN